LPGKLVPPINRDQAATLGKGGRKGSGRGDHFGSGIEGGELELLQSSSVPPGHQPPAIHRHPYAVDVIGNRKRTVNTVDVVISSRCRALCLPHCRGLRCLRLGPVSVLLRSWASVGSTV